MISITLTAARRWQAPQRRAEGTPWFVEETDACFIVRDANGQALAYVYFEEEPGRRAAARPPAHPRNEARRIAANITQTFLAPNL